MITFDIKFHLIFPLENTWAKEKDAESNNDESVKLKKPVYFLSLVGSDASDIHGKGVPRKALSFFDIRSEMEFEGYDRIYFLSAQDLLNYYQKQTGMSGEHLNVYQLSIFFIERNPDGIYILDEVPLIQGNGMSKFLEFL